MVLIYNFFIYLPTIAEKCKAKALDPDGIIIGGLRRTHEYHE
jgi:hypothetical protein